MNAGSCYRLGGEDTCREAEVDERCLITIAFGDDSGGGTIFDHDDFKSPLEEFAKVSFCAEVG